MIFVISTAIAIYDTAKLYYDLMIEYKDDKTSDNPYKVLGPIGLTTFISFVILWLILYFVIKIIGNQAKMLNIMNDFLSIVLAFYIISIRIAIGIRDYAKNKLDKR